MSGSEAARQSVFGALANGQLDQVASPVPRSAALLAFEYPIRR